MIDPAEIARLTEAVRITEERELDGIFGMVSMQAHLARKLLDAAERCARLEALLRECVAPSDECPTACLLLETRKGRYLRDRIAKELDK